MSDQMNSVEKSMRNNLRSVSSFTTNKCCIYKVPEYGRKEREECYRPLTVSIGPVHYKDPKLEDMQEVKWIYLKNFLECNTNNSFGFYIDTIRKREQEIRVYYQHKISHIPSDDFIEMILLDAAFIIYHFMEVYYGFNIKPPLEDWQRFLRVFSTRDLILMENQLPFFILEDLHLKAFGTNHVSFKVITHKYMASYDMIFGDGIVNTRDAIDRMKNRSNIKNLIDFVLICYSPTDELVNNNMGDNNLPKSMTVKDLHAGGVKFVASDDESKNPLDIKFDKNNGVLLIPKIEFNKYTESVLRNVLYYDQCHNAGADHFNDYIYFLRTLINTVEDAEILVQSGVIIDKELNNECVVDVLNKIDTSYSDKFNYGAIQRDLVEYANIPWNRWKAILKRDYFQHPWAIISVIFAVIIFIISGFIK